MASLANAQPSTGYVAAQEFVTNALTGMVNFMTSFSRALAFSRMCEAEFNRTGKIAPETFKRFIDQV